MEQLNGFLLFVAKERWERSAGRRHYWVFHDPRQAVNLDVQFSQFLLAIKGRRVREVIEKTSYALLVDETSATRLVLESNIPAHLLTVGSMGDNGSALEASGDLGEQSNIRLPTVLHLHRGHRIAIDISDTCFKLGCLAH